MKAPSVLDVETQNMLADGFRRFSHERPGRGEARTLDSDAGETALAWKQLAEHGWLRLGLPEAIGGYGGGIAPVALLASAAGEGFWCAPLLQCLGEACGALLAAPPGGARNSLLGAIAAGEALVGLADRDAEEPAQAVRVDANYRITGHKSFLLGGGAWTHYLVTAGHAAESDVSLYLVPKSAPGLGVRCFMALDGSCAADIHLDGVTAERIAHGPQLLVAARHRGQLLAAAEQAGIARAALEATTRHLAARRQFGQAILQFQAVQHRLVEAHICIRELVSLLDVVQTAYDTAHGNDLDRLVWKLRAQASLTSTRVTQLGIQFHGGMGMTAAMPLGDYYKRVMLIDSLFGSWDAVMEQLSETLDLQPQQGNRHAD